MDRYTPSLTKCGSRPLICLKYIAGSLKTQINEAIYHMLVKILKFSTTKMQCAHKQSRGPCLGCNVGLKEGERGGQMLWDL